MAFLFLLNFILIIFIWGYSGSIAVYSFLIFFQIIGVGLSYLLANKNNQDLKNLVRIFFIVFFIYMLFALIAYWGYLENTGFFIYPDQNTFYNLAAQLGDFNSIKRIFDACFIYKIHIVNEGALFYFGSLAFIANKYFDGNSVLFQIINVSFLAILINLFIYKILLFYVKRNVAFKYTIYYSLFTFVLAYSPWILRDIHIALLFVIAIYIIHLPFSLKNLISLIILLIITLEFRFVSGVAFIFFPLFYLYNNVRRNKHRILYKIAFTSFVLLILVYFLKEILPILNVLTHSLKGYSKYTSTAAERGGLGGIIYHLPVGIKQIAIIFYSQIAPFPPWFYLKNSTSIIQYVHGVVRVVSPVFWGFVFFIFVKDFKKHYKGLSDITKYLTIFMGVFFLASSVNMGQRRIMAIYPVMYIVFVYFQSFNTVQQKVKSRLQYISLYIVFILVYSVLKFL